MGVFTVVLAWKLYRRFDLPPVEEWAARALSVFGVVGIFWVGAIGGQLVFEHAAGIPSAVMQAELDNRGAGHEHEPGEAEHEHDATMADTSDSGAGGTQPHVDPPGAKPHTH
jgi:hypothetical protein